MTTSNLKRAVLPRVVLVALAMVFSGSHYASSQLANYPIANKIADKVIMKYQNMSCADLKTDKSTPPTPQEADMKQKATMQLKSNPEMRTLFLNKVAPAIANKMFECGMLP